MVLSLDLSHKWNLRQIDINNAFLHGDLTKEVYLVQPPGFEEISTSDKSLVCKLTKAIYGLNQAPRAWFKKLKNFLITYLQFQAFVADSCLFIK